MGILEEIFDGEWDDKLDRILGAVNSRKQTIALRTVSTLDVGDVIRIKDCRPKYLVGKQGVVREILGDKVVLQMPDDYALRKYRNIRLTVPAAMVEVV